MVMLALDPLKKYAQFAGRARRAEYWQFTLLMAVGIAFLIAIRDLGGSTLGAALLALFWLGMFLPSLAVSVRRLHDTSRSGWWVLISFLPLVGGVVLLVFDCLEGTKGPNRYGPDPKGPTADVTVFSDEASTPGAAG
jgi:uncharacterized membrane protein YhaH (DUF805 family)